MKVASVSFHWSKNQVGGAQIPAAAYRDWMIELGHECDLLAFTSSGRPSVGFSTPGKLITHPMKDYWDVLNSYDFIYFATPGFMKAEVNFQTYFLGLSKPFAIHIHGEYDNNLYPDLEKIVSHHCCKMLYVVSNEARKHWNFNIKKFVFYPCTLPGYLIRDHDKWDITDRKGLIYAARLTTLKHPKILANFSKNKEFRSQCQGDIDVLGIAPIFHIEQEMLQLEPVWNRFPSFYNVYDVRATKEMFSKYRFYWEVFGNKKYTKFLRRFNLSAAEAVGCGVIPIVYEPMCPEWLLPLKPPSVDFKNPDVGSLTESLEVINMYYSNIAKNLRGSLLNSEYSYDFVRTMIKLSLEESL